MEKLKGQLLQQVCGNKLHRDDDADASEVLKLTKREAAEAQESLKVIQWNDEFFAHQTFLRPEVLRYGRKMRVKIELIQKQLILFMYFTKQ